VFLAVALVYLLGLMFLTTTKGCTDLVMRLIRGTSKAKPWENAYWRRVVSAYVGKDLLPTTRKLSPEEMTGTLKYILAMAQSKTDTKPLTSSLDTADHLQKLLTRMEESIDRAHKTNPEKAKEVLDPLSGEIAQARQSVGKLREEVTDAQAIVGGLATEVEWMSLCTALEFIPRNVENPYTSFLYLMEAMQSAGIAGICVILLYPQIRTLAGVAFGAVLILISTYSLWLTFQLNGMVWAMSSVQIAAMLAELRKTPAENT
jgi:hypothetical protein